MLVVGRPPWTGDSPVLLALHLLLVGLLAVSAEALWRVRPWCTRAVFWTAVAAFALVVATAIAFPPVDVFAGFVGVVAIAAWLARLVGYVDRTAESLFQVRGPRAPRGDRRRWAGAVSRGRR